MKGFSQIMVTVNLIGHLPLIFIFLNNFKSKLFFSIHLIQPIFVLKFLRQEYFKIGIGKTDWKLINPVFFKKLAISL